MPHESCLSGEFTGLEQVVLDMCSAMHCGTQEEVEDLRHLLYARYGGPGWLMHGGVLAGLTDLHAPASARDLTGAVLPHNVLVLEADHMRQAMAATGLPPVRLEEMLEHNRRAITHTTQILAAAHFQEAGVALRELHAARTHHPETLTATLSLLLRIAADCIPCPRHALPERPRL